MRTPADAENSDESMRETRQEKIQRYNNSTQDEVSDPDLWADLHYGPRSPDREEDLVDVTMTDGRPSQSRWLCSPPLFSLCSRPLAQPVPSSRCRSSSGPAFSMANQQRRSQPRAAGEARAVGGRPDGPDVNKDRLIFCITSLIGQKVTASLRNNALISERVQYEGMFHSCALDGDYSITLKSARRLFSDTNNRSTEVPTLLIPGKDFLQVSAMNVPPPSPAEEGRKGFATDAEISRTESSIRGELEIVLDLGRLSKAAALLLPCGMASTNSRFRRSKGTTGSAGVAVSAGTLLAAKPVEAGWDVISGEDVENSAVLEQHRFGMQMSLLGQGTPEGFVDHEFPAQARSIDGLEGPPVRRGQEALMQLLTAPERDDDDEDEDVPDAPRCPCGRRGRQGHVQVNGMVAKRPYFRCANRGCRFFSFGELASSSGAQSLPWMRLRTSEAPNHPSRTTLSQSLVVVGRDGFRPEDVRLGQKSEALGDVLFLEALAVLAERPNVLDKLLPNSGSASGCHEVRLCVAGLWRSFLIDERFPMLPAANSKNPHESLAFGRSAGNQLWIPLLEKAYAKAYAAYQFAFPAPLQVFLEELTGAVVELVRLGSTSWSSRGCPFDAEELWIFLSRQVADGTLVVCSARFVPAGSSSVFPILEIGGNGGPTCLNARLLRLRNPRVSGSPSGNIYETTLSLLRGRSADASTYADGSFWISYGDFLSSFSLLYVCHAASAGGSLKHTRTFEGDFTSPSDGLGTRGCTLRVSTLSTCDLWISCLQPIPKGTRLLQPCM
eukprot:s929_g1.t1